MDEKSKIKEESSNSDELEEKSIEDLESELKILQKKIIASSSAVKDKLEKKVEAQGVSEKSKVSITSRSEIEELDEENLKKKAKEKEIEKLWALYKWAKEPEKFPWMYWIPDKKSGVANWKENLESWKNDWSKFTLDYARAFILHTLDILELSKEKPYINLNDRLNALNLIFANLVEMKRGSLAVAKWTNKEKSKIRIYWRSLEEWANLFYDWALNGGGDVFTLMDLKKAGNEIIGFETLPEDDYKEIIQILVKSKKAKWIDKDLVRVKIIFKT